MSSVATGPAPPGLKAASVAKARTVARMLRYKIGTESCNGRRDGEKAKDFAKNLVKTAKWIFTVTG
jgi:hypothetical protein